MRKEPLDALRSNLRFASRALEEVPPERLQRAREVRDRALVAVLIREIEDLAETFVATVGTLLDSYRILWSAGDFVSEHGPPLSVLLLALQAPAALGNVMKDFRDSGEGNKRILDHIAALERDPEARLDPRIGIFATGR